MLADGYEAERRRDGTADAAIVAALPIRTKRCVSPLRSRFLMSFLTAQAIEALGSAALDVM